MDSSYRFYYPENQVYVDGKTDTMRLYDNGARAGIIRVAMWLGLAGVLFSIGLILLISVVTTEAQEVPEDNTFEAQESPEDNTLSILLGIILAVAGGSGIVRSAYLLILDALPYRALEKSDQDDLLTYGDLLEASVIFAGVIGRKYLVDVVFYEKDQRIQQQYEFSRWDRRARRLRSGDRLVLLYAEAGNYRIL